MIIMNATRNPDATNADVATELEVVEVGDGAHAIRYFVSRTCRRTSVAADGTALEQTVVLLFAAEVRRLSPEGVVEP